ncbi:hypothetical protein CYMTET_17260 [Cymbomonas tetramitiformis]|uniref:Uncharacterized protein n=1 Tax=Cymbomonas tetramitiformis TaxID=36881 RepID=A0AAE0L748_9CHLO|nr:hypothetical protein CYMTET_17260 [Cymbomonas tetramitiformis]
MKIYNTKYRFPNKQPGMHRGLEPLVNSVSIKGCMVGSNIANNQPSMRQHFEDLDNSLTKALTDKLAEGMDDIKSKEEFESDAEPLSVNAHVALLGACSAEDVTAIVLASGTSRGETKQHEAMCYLAAIEEIQASASIAVDTEDAGGEAR